MTTTDPRIARAERQALDAKSPRTRLLLIIIGVIHCGLWVAAGFGLGIVLDTFRLMTVNQTGHWTSDFGRGSGELTAIGAIAVGAVLGIYFAGRLAQAGFGAALLVPFCTGLLGIALGLVLFIPSWSTPDIVGEKVPFIDGGVSTPWESDAWIAYYLPYWLPAVFTIVLLLAVLATVAATRSSRRRNEKMHDLATQGTKVRGLVTEAIATGTEIQGMPRIQFTAKFQDAAGVDRWVTKKATFPPASTPRAGDIVIVWFDPASPDDEKRIMIGFGPEPADSPTVADAVVPVLPLDGSRG